jgi:hypothetical protein
MATVNTSLVRSLATPHSHQNRIISTSSFLSNLLMPFGAVLSGTLCFFTRHTQHYYSIGCFCYFMCYSEVLFTVSEVRAIKGIY